MNSNTYKNKNKQITYEYLPNYSYFSINGNNSKDIIQNLITNNINLISENKSIASLFCSRKGNVIASTIIFIDKDIFIFRVDNNIYDYLFSHIMKCCMFDKISIVKYEQKYSTIINNNHIMDNSITTVKYKNILHSIIRYKNLPKTIHDYTNSFNLYKINYGLIEITNDNTDKYNPFQIIRNSDDYISYTKGCYLGQEIIARLKYLSNKSSIIILFTIEPTYTPSINEKVYLGSNKGEILSLHINKDNIKILVIFKKNITNISNIININNKTLLIHKHKEL